jgi:1,4-alpha-glucan branching enzyme
MPLALVLHSHMPYVEGYGTWPFGEEWLWEAVATVYLPLLEVLDSAPITLGLTPVLCDQLETLPGEAGDRLLAFLREIRALVHEEDARGLERSGAPELAREVRRAAGDYAAADGAFEERGRDVLGALAALDGVELLTSAATHAVLPLLATDVGLRLQVGTGIASHERRFDRWDGGFWLPECAYEPGLEGQLARHGVRAFCVDQTDVHGLGALEQLEPVRTDAGPVAVPIDWQTVGLVWHDAHGYPTHSVYRDYHARTVHDLKPWNNGGGAYDHGAALRLAEDHATDFVRRAAERLRAFERERGREGLLCCALDTELLGHWWYEGPAWLRAVLDEAGAAGVELVTLSAGLDRVEPVEGRALVESSWGTGRDLSTWDSPKVAELAFAARTAELHAVHELTLQDEPRAAAERALRELLALQASDWAFMETRELAGEYPIERVREHGASYAAALAALKGSAHLPKPSVRNLAPYLDTRPIGA